MEDVLCVCSIFAWTGTSAKDGECGDGNLGMCFLVLICLQVTLYIHGVIECSGSLHAQHGGYHCGPLPYCTDWHDVTLLAVYQSLAISMRTMVKALPRAYAMPVCRPKVAGGSELWCVAMAMIPRREGGMWGASRIEFGASLDRANGTVKLDMSQGL